MITTAINCETDLVQVAAALHDARFTADAIKYDSESDTISLKCWVLGRSPKEERVSRRWKGNRLTFSTVMGCKIETREAAPYYELATIRFDKQDCRMDLVAHYGIEISFRVRELLGTLVETGETEERWK